MTLTLLRRLLPESSAMNPAPTDPLFVFTPHIETGRIPREEGPAVYRYLRWGRVEIRIYSHSVLDRMFKSAVDDDEFAHDTIQHRAA